MKNLNDDYLKIWQTEQEDIKLRWTLVTFFITVSFAIFGFSVQNKIQTIPAFLQQILAILVYWFAFLIHIILHKYTMFLRDYLRKMENNNETNLRLRTGADEFLSHGFNISVTSLLVILGCLYTIIVGITMYLTK